MDESTVQGKSVRNPFPEEEGGAGGGSGDEAEIPLQPMVEPWSGRLFFCIPWRSMVDLVIAIAGTPVSSQARSKVRSS